MAANIFIFILKLLADAVICLILCWWEDQTLMVVNLKIWSKFRRISLITVFYSLLFLLISDNFRDLDRKDASSS